MALYGTPTPKSPDDLGLDGVPCLLLKFAGKPIDRLLHQEGPQTLDFTIRWGEDLLRGLQSLEEAGVLHRDIKPS
jgi:serine/threonine protein kinase